MGSVLRTLGRWLAALVMGLGVAAFGVGLLVGIVMLQEGVTGLVGEGSRLPTESPEQVRGRVALVCGLLAAVPVGWLLARLGDAYRRTDGRRLRLLRLLAEVFLLVGGVGLMLGFIVWYGPRAGGHVVSDAYRWLGLIGGCGGFGSLVGGWLLLRWSAKA